MIVSDERVALTPVESLALLNDAPVGRIVFTDQTLPAVEPVYFTMDDDAVIVRTTAGSRLARSIHDSIVAFEVDNSDLEPGSGWSVTALGRAEVVTEPTELARLSLLPSDGMELTAPVHYVRIRLRRIHGYRVAVERCEVTPHV
ncbi:pyridoxamine 5'-phosphate oxidase family protein [Actinopolymorpha alba]|uniref:pyridoxamine 5'-phosphate oxidase family protein n=1 Tax=Actinopolymorpha alba TaxID=533267 RepID=UPI0003807278|nr:pyridoxamine 5'-phosphate oxidase family protein [Actinopolymorpha alba]